MDDPIGVVAVARVSCDVLTGRQKVSLDVLKRLDGRVVAVLELSHPQRSGDLPQLERDGLVQLERLDGLDHREGLGVHVLERLDLGTLGTHDRVDLVEHAARLARDGSREDVPGHSADNPAGDQEASDNTDDEQDCRDPGGDGCEHAVSKVGS